MPSEKGSKTKKRRSTYSRVFETFAGAYLNFIIKGIKAADVRPGKITNLMFAGYLLDEDELHYFIGQTPDEVYAIIKKDEVAGIMISDEVGDLMNEVKLPEGQDLQ